jgi:ubiquinol-cytochrome c reductase cytochrome b subunit
MPLLSQQPQDKPHPAPGDQLFQTSGCTHCHQMNGQGGTKGPDLTAVGDRRTPPFLKHQIQQGSAGMPAFQDALSEEEVDALVLYLQNCRKKK